MTRIGRPWRRGGEDVDPDEVAALLAHLEAVRARRETDHLRAKSIECPACAAGEHGGCVRPCHCGGARHGRGVAHVP